MTHTAPPAAALPDPARRVRFVLVAPTLAANIGAAARALATMGFARLVVVAPQASDFQHDADAVALATSAGELLRAAAVQPDLAAALKGVQLAFAMTGYDREFGPRRVALRAAAAEAQAHLAAHEGDVAFVFGTERSGLTNADVLRCQACCAIPTGVEHTSLNLAQAVQVVAYECRLALHGDALLPSRFADEAPASADEVERMLAHLEQGLVALGVLDPHTPRQLMMRLRRLLTRAQPTATEIDILRGVAAAMVEPKRDRIGTRRARR
jgi:tRNA/rRNA methyltransferase